jgi:hypothetical protein
MTFLSVARLGIPAVVSISAGISPWIRFSRSLYPAVADPNLSIFSHSFLKKKTGDGIDLIPVYNP